MVICLEQGADLHMAQMMPLPLTVSCFSKIQTGFTFLVPAHLGSPGKGPLNGCVCVRVRNDYNTAILLLYFTAVQLMLKYSFRDKGTQSASQYTNTTMPTAHPSLSCYRLDTTHNVRVYVEFVISYQ